MTYPLASQRLIKHLYGRIPARLIGLRLGKTADQIHDWAYRHGLSSKLGRKKRARIYSDNFYAKLLLDFESQTTRSLANKHGVSISCMEKMLQRARAVTSSLETNLQISSPLMDTCKTRENTMDGSTLLVITMSPTTLPSTKR